MVRSSGPRGVLMVGSIPLGSTEEVFTTLCKSLPGRLSTIPDGETGDRWNYIGWQLERFPSETRRLELGGIELPEGSEKPKYTIESVKPTGYNEAAIASYSQFVRLRSTGVIPPGVRFQISLPTPFNCIVGHLKPESQAEMEPLYEQRILESLDAISACIPHQGLVIKWDLCFDIITLEYARANTENPRFKPYFEDISIKEGLLKRLERLCKALPVDIRLAFHLCYGDLRHKHFVEPQDTDLVVDFANDILERICKTHTIEWIHIPVPRDRIDAAYFEPLKRLSFRDGKADTALYLGLVHANDEHGTRERIQVATSVYGQPFGVATECGMGRTPKEDIESILSILKNVIEPLYRPSLA